MTTLSRQKQVLPPWGSGCCMESLWVLLAVLGLLMAAEVAPTVPSPQLGSGTGQEQPPCSASCSHSFWSCLSPQGVAAGRCGCRTAEDSLIASPASPPAPPRRRAVGAPSQRTLSCGSFPGWASPGYFGKLGLPSGGVSWQGSAERDSTRAMGSCWDRQGAGL